MRRSIKRISHYAVNGLFVIIGSFCQAFAMLFLHLMPRDTAAPQLVPALLLLVLELFLLTLAAMRTFHPLHMPRS